MKYLKNPYWPSLAAYVSLVGVWFGFISICHWEYDPALWSPWGRYLLGLVALVALRLFKVKW